MNIRLFSFILILFILTICNCCKNNTASSGHPNENIPIIEYVYINSYPHDMTSFTEGLFIHNGNLFESTGALKELPQTKSLFGIVNLETGIIDVKVEIDKEKYFGEGITYLNGQIFQLTYKNKVGFVYDTITFKKITEFRLPSEEGWGLTTDGAYLIMSNGTNILTFIDPKTFQVIKTISVTAGGHKTKNIRLNELEYIRGFVYANIWPTSTIVKINLMDGKVLGQLNLDSLANDAHKIGKRSYEMNGIAFDCLSDRVFITGKLWPKIYEIGLNY